MKEATGKMRDPLRVGLLARGLSVEIGGARVYLERLIPELVAGHPEQSYVIFHGSAAHRGRFPGAEEVFLRAPSAFVWENMLFPLALRRHRVDVLVCPKNLVPWFVPRSIRTVAVVLDLLYFPVMGRPFEEYKWSDVAYMRTFLPRSLRRTDQVCAISEHTRKDVLNLFGLAPSTVRVMHLGVEAPDACREDGVRAVRARHGLERPYIFYAGSLSPRKNMARLVEAFGRIQDRVPHDLVVTAGKSWKDRAVFEQVEKSGLAHRWKRLGKVSSEDLPALYQGASAFVYPSLYEGFGLPLLEAMACGCPVLASNRSSLPEVAGEAALLVDPENVGEMSEALLKLLTDEHLAGTLRARGLERARAFPWAKTATVLNEAILAAGQPLMGSAGA